MITVVRASSEETGSDWYLVDAENDQEAIEAVWYSLEHEPGFTFEVEDLGDVLYSQYRGLARMGTV